MFFQKNTNREDLTIYFKLLKSTKRQLFDELSKFMNPRSLDRTPSIHES